MICPPNENGRFQSPSALPTLSKSVEIHYLPKQFRKESEMTMAPPWCIRSQPFPPTSEWYYVRAILEYPARGYIEISHSCIFAVWLELASLSVIRNVSELSVKLFLQIFVLVFFQSFHACHKFYYFIASI